jgi:hypothetical protein
MITIAGWIDTGCCAFFGFNIVSFLLHKTIDVVFLIGMGSALGIVLSAWIAYLLNFFFPLSYNFGLGNITIVILLAIPDLGDFGCDCLSRRLPVLVPPPWSAVQRTVCTRFRLWRPPFSS